MTTTIHRPATHPWRRSWPKVTRCAYCGAALTPGRPCPHQDPALGSPSDFAFEQEDGR